MAPTSDSCGLIYCFLFFSEPWYYITTILWSFIWIILCNEVAQTHQPCLAPFHLLKQKVWLRHSTNFFYILLYQSQTICVESHSRVRGNCSNSNIFASCVSFEDSKKAALLELFVSTNVRVWWQHIHQTQCVRSLPERHVCFLSFFFYPSLSLDIMKIGQFLDSSQHRDWHELRTNKGTN